MSKHTQKVMEDMLQNEGFRVKVTMGSKGYKVKAHNLTGRVTLTLEYPAISSPGEVVFAARETLKRLADEA